MSQQNYSHADCMAILCTDAYMYFCWSSIKFLIQYINLLKQWQEFFVEHETGLQNSQKNLHSSNLKKSLGYI